MSLVLMLAFAMQESSLNPNALGDKKDNKYLAYGLFQFHEDRWKECSKEPRINATIETQIKAFLKEYDNYKKIKGIKHSITGFANYHNLGHHSTKETKYTKSIKKWLKYFSDPNHKVIKNETEISNIYKGVNK